MKDYIEKRDKNAERRFESKIEVRGDDDGQTIEGIAAVVDKKTDMGWYVERIAPGAFEDVMGDDVVALLNHDPNFPLARTTSEEAKLELFTADNGDLGYRFRIPNTQVGRDIAENIRTGVISKSSFAFTIEDEVWERNKDNEGEVSDLRTITKVRRLYDVSPVTYPAYPQTSVAARSFEIYEKPNKEILDDKIARDKDLRNLDVK